MKITAGRPLGDVKEGLKAQVDAEAEAFCLRFVTPGATQAMRYQRKEQIARAWLADTSQPVPAAIQVEVGITAATPLEVAETIVGYADSWGHIADRVEELRLGAKKAVDDAETAAAARAAAVVDWDGAVASLMAALEETA